MTTRRGHWLIGAVVVALLSGSVLVGTPIEAAAAPIVLGVPDKEVVTPVTGDPALGDDVEQTYVRLHYPSPFSTANHPEECDWISYLRYRSTKGPKDSAKADAILTMQPGLYSGAANLNAQAPQVVRKAAAQGKYVEYLSIDRRANCAEDRTGWVAAEEAGDYHVAANYYFGGAEIDGKKYHYKTPQDLAFLGEYGLALTLDDWRAVIAHVLPNEADRTKSFCGGHSLGAFLVGPMMAWDFDGKRETEADAGFNLCGGGSVPLDGFAMTDPAGLQGTGLLDEFVSTAGGFVRKGVDYLLANGLGVGQLPVIAASEVMNTYQLAAMAAAQDPAGESDLGRIVPADLRTEPWMRLFYGRDYLDLFTGANLPRDFRITNTTQLAMFFDQNSAEYVLQTGMGFYDCPVQGKTYPIPNGLSSVPILGPTIFVIPQRVGFGQNYTPADKSTLCGWRNYDAVAESSIDGPDLGHGPPTDQDHEVTDVQQFARAMNPGGQPTDFFELYTPIKLITDMIFALGVGRDGDLEHLEYRSGGVLDFLLHLGRWQSTPAGQRNLTLLSGDSPVQNAGLGGLLPYNAKFLPGYRHYDVVTAAEKQNNGVPELASSYIAGFITKPVS